MPIPRPAAANKAEQQPKRHQRTTSVPESHFSSTQLPPPKNTDSAIRQGRSPTRLPKPSRQPAPDNDIDRRRSLLPQPGASGRSSSQRPKPPAQSELREDAGTSGAGKTPGGQVEAAPEPEQRQESRPASTNVPAPAQQKPEAGRTTRPRARPLSMYGSGPSSTRRGLNLDSSLGNERRMAPEAPKPASAPTDEQRKADVGKAPQRRPRPISVYGSAIPSNVSASRSAEGSGKASPAEEAKPRSVPSSGLSRSQSLRKPASSAASTTRTFNLRSQVPNAAAKSAPLLKPSTPTIQVPPRGGGKRGDRPASAASTASRTSADVPSTASRTSAAPKTVKPIAPSGADARRAATTSTRPSRAASDASTIQSKPPLARPTPNMGRARQTSSEEGAKQGRPGFTTFQQHFSPKKSLAPKPPMSAILSGSASTKSNRVTSSTLLQQAELLHLHLLHSESAKTYAEWTHNAERALREKFDEIAALQHAVRETERDVQEQANLRVLGRWGGGNTMLGLAEPVQQLSSLLQDLPSLTDPGGRYERLVEAFGRWLADVESVWQKREQRPGPSLTSTSPLAPHVAEPLPVAWKSENVVLSRKIGSMLRDLDRLPSAPPGGSSLAVVIVDCRALLKGMSEELAIMRDIEIEVSRSEGDWVDKEVKQIMDGVEGTLILIEADTTTSGREAWRLA